MPERVWFTSNAHPLSPFHVRGLRAAGIIPCISDAQGFLTKSAWAQLGVEVLEDGVDSPRPAIIAHFDNPPPQLFDTAAVLKAELWTFLHTETHIHPIQRALELGLKVVALDAVFGADGERIFGSKYLTGRNGARMGLALAKSNPRTVVIGAGNCASHALKELFHHVDVELPGKDSTREWLLRRLPEIDLLVSGVDLPLMVKGLDYILRREDVARMRPGSVIIDLIVDYDKLCPIETCRPTVVQDPIYVAEGVVHSCVWGWPDMTPDEAAAVYYRQFADVYRKVRKL